MIDIRFLYDGFVRHVSNVTFEKETGKGKTDAIKKCSVAMPFPEKFEPKRAHYGSFLGTAHIKRHLANHLFDIEAG